MDFMGLLAGGGAGAAGRYRDALSSQIYGAVKMRLLSLLSLRLSFQFGDAKRSLFAEPRVGV